MFKSVTTVLVIPFLAMGIARAEVVLNIDLSDPSHVVVTAVNSDSQSDATTATNNGVTLQGFFSTDQDIGQSNFVLVSGDLTAHGSTTPFDTIETFNYSDGTGNIQPGKDLSLWSFAASSGENEVFITTAAPFTGIGTFDLSAFGSLPGFGTTGNIYSGYLSSEGQVLGQWQVVPEPSTLALGMGGLLVMICLLRRRSFTSQS